LIYYETHRWSFYIYIYIYIYNTLDTLPSKKIFYILNISSLNLTFLPFFSLNINLIPNTMNESWIRHFIIIEINIRFFFLFIISFKDFASDVKTTGKGKGYFFFKEHEKGIFIHQPSSNSWWTSQIKYIFNYVPIY
jgi:hypothetical protein